MTTEDKGQTFGRVSKRRDVVGEVKELRGKKERVMKGWSVHTRADG